MSAATNDELGVALRYYALAADTTGTKIAGGGEIMAI